MFSRNIVLPASGEETFFLWGPRQTGKSTLLKRRYPRSRWLDLLRADEFRRYAANPEFLRQEIEADGRPAPGEQIVIDEIQKGPSRTGSFTSSQPSAHTEAPTSTCSTGGSPAVRRSTSCSATCGLWSRPRPAPGPPRITCGGCAAWRANIPKPAGASSCAWSRGRDAPTTVSTSFRRRTSFAASGAETSRGDSGGIDVRRRDARGLHPIRACSVRTFEITCDVPGCSPGELRRRDRGDGPRRRHRHRPCEHREARGSASRCTGDRLRGQAACSRTVISG